MSGDTLSPVSPLCAVVVAWFAVTLPVGVFEDQPLMSIIHSSGTRRHAVRTISKVGACHTLVCTLSSTEGKAEKYGGELRERGRHCKLTKAEHKDIKGEEEERQIKFLSIIETVIIAIFF